MFWGSNSIGAMLLGACLALGLAVPVWAESRTAQPGAPATGTQASSDTETFETVSASADSAAMIGAAGAAVPVLTRPKARIETLPHARWAHRAEAALWTRAALAALKDHGRPLVDMVPADIGVWCPAYALAGPEQRRAFWVGFLSALTKHESTYRPNAVGGGGLWYGLLQILPSTARLYKCRARSGAALKNGPANLSCAIRIMARTVTRDGVIHAYTKKYKRRWRGVSADWGPMRSSKKRADMARWLKDQSYCTPLETIRPKLRPAGLAVGTARLPDAVPG